MSFCYEIYFIQAKTSKTRTDSSVQQWRRDHQSRRKARTQRSLDDRLRSEFDLNLDVSDDTDTEEVVHHH